jgi:hypothetical protein
MSTFYMNWAAFEVSTADVVDRTTYSVQLRHPEHENIRLVVWHMAAPPGKTVRELAARRVSEEMVRLDGYTILEQHESLWCDSPAVDVASRWRHEGAVWYQRQAHFVLDDLWRSFSLGSPLASRAACDEWFEQIRTSLRTRSASEGG